MLRSILTAIVILLFTAHAWCQQVFQHTSTSANTSGHISSLDHPATNNKTDAIIIVTQQFGKYNPNEIGVWYSDGKWKIFNQNRSAIPENTIFNVLVLDPATNPNASVHTTSNANTKGHISTIASRFTKGKENVAVFVTQRFGQYNTSPVGVWYSNGEWKIYNENRQPMPLNTQFNILVLEEGASKVKGLNSIVFQHGVKDSNRLKFPGKHVSYIDNAALNNQKSAIVFSTQRYVGAYNTSITGVWYDEKQWTVFNQDRKAIPENIAFNILAVQSGDVLLTPVLVRNRIGIRAKDSGKSNWRAATKVNQNKIFVLPYNEAAQPSSSEETSSTEIQGPDLELSKDITSFISGAGSDQLITKLNLFRELYQDKNPKSGYFYYLPKNYNLQWNAETGNYSFYIYYLSADQEGRGEVIITAELTPNISKDDIAVAEAILSKNLNKEVKLRPLPLKDTPKVSFGSSLTNFDVKDESVQTNVPSDFLEPVIVSWKMERRVDDFIGAMMNNIGVSGHIQFLPHGEGEKLITVPVKLKINDPQTYGKMEYTQASSFLNGFYNPIDYPLQLKNLVVLRSNTNKDYQIETIPLGNYQIEPQKLFSAFTQSEKDAILNGDVITRMWVDYSIKPCSTCNAAVQRKIMGGTSGNRVQKIELQILSPLEFSRANSLKLMIKSTQGDPNGTSDVLLPIINITKDNQTLSGGDLFVPEGATPAYQYQVVLIQADGSTVGSEWIDAKELFIVIGENTIRSHFATDEDTEGEVTEESEGEPEDTQPLEADGN